VRVHSSAAGRFEAVEERERFRLTEPPAAAVPAESVKLDWAHRKLLEGNSRANRRIDLRKSAVCMGWPKTALPDGNEATSTERYRSSLKRL
jgi:hypothetical protein